MNKYYYTFGSSEQFPFQGGYVEVHAETRSESNNKFRAKYPDVNEGILNCAFIYDEAKFTNSDMYKNNLGAGCHDMIE